MIERDGRRPCAASATAPIARRARPLHPRPGATSSAGRSSTASPPASATACAATTDVGHARPRPARRRAGAPFAGARGGHDVHDAAGCTACDRRWYSHRARGEPERFATMAWLEDARERWPQALERVRERIAGGRRRSRPGPHRRGHQGPARRARRRGGRGAGSSTSARATPRSWWPRPSTGRPLDVACAGTSSAASSATRSGSCAGFVHLWQSVDRLSLAAEIAQRAPGAAGARPGERHRQRAAGRVPARAGRRGRRRAAATSGSTSRASWPSARRASDDEVRAAFRTVRALADDLGAARAVDGHERRPRGRGGRGATMVRVGTDLVGPRSGGVPTVGK